ncbi:hypothetical protein FQN60_006216 [Etheostoma spectabile]|uniref:Uncharacterized protein n=1 Tax=Etheostoma spectabile TaxID=54343 RepID=A0A5J5CP89_9PERO|nr:hypothetical protein FQN60_006216 [Etheostoma spectabile]
MMSPVKWYMLSGGAELETCCSRRSSIPHFEKHGPPVMMEGTGHSSKGILGVALGTRELPACP